MTISPPNRFTGRTARRSKAKGSGFEREIAKALTEHGVNVERVGFQAGMKNGTAHDLAFRLRGVELTGECKRRADGFRQLYDWLQAADILFLRADRKPSLVVLPLPAFLGLTESED